MYNLDVPSHPEPRGPFRIFGFSDLVFFDKGHAFHAIAKSGVEVLVEESLALDDSRRVEAVRRLN